MADFSVGSAALLVAVGLIAAFINTAAGAGSLLSLRALMLLGLGADVANGTNRVPVLVQSVVAARGFSKHGALPTAGLGRSILVASLGAICGSVVASYTPERVMRFVLIGVLLAVAFFSAFGPKTQAPKEGDAVASPEGGMGLVVGLFVSGLYGGFLQAGVGLMLLFTLSGLGKMPLLSANAQKVVIVAVFSVFGLGVFLLRGQVSLPHAGLLSVGAALGAVLGVRYAVRFASSLKFLVVVVDVGACVVLLLREIW